MKHIILIAALFMANAASAQQATDATAGVVRVLDKVTGAARFRRLDGRLGACAERDGASAL